MSSPEGGTSVRRMCMPGASSPNALRSGLTLGKPRGEILKEENINATIAKASGPVSTKEDICNPAPRKDVDDIALDLEESNHHVNV